MKELLGELGLRPTKALGHNFLIDQNILDILLDAAEVTPRDTVLEVGPGLGTVTERLLESAGRVIAVEKDAKLYGHVRRALGYSHSLELIHSDILDVDLADLVHSGMTKIVSNLPYSVGSRFLVEIARLVNVPATAVVTVQLEVARRLAARPGTSDYGLLSVFAQLAYDIEIRRTVSPTCFWPVPDVRSAIVKMVKRKPDGVTLEDRSFFYTMVKHAFQHRRKQLATILGHLPFVPSLTKEKAVSILDNLAHDVRSRPADLSAKDWCLLVNKVWESREK